MSAATQPNSDSRYEVRLGHLTVRVDGSSRDDAIRAARRQFCEEFPRLWDLIENAETSRFQVIDRRP